MAKVVWAQQFRLSEDKVSCVGGWWLNAKSLLPPRVATVVLVVFELEFHTGTEVGNPQQLFETVDFRTGTGVENPQLEKIDFRTGTEVENPHQWCEKKNEQEYQSAVLVL